MAKWSKESGLETFNMILITNLKNLILMCLTETYISKTGKCLAIFCLVMNVILPGFGTIVNGC